MASSDNSAAAEPLPSPADAPPFSIDAKRAASASEATSDSD
jgi:hypothetical protein